MEATAASEVEERKVALAAGEAWARSAGAAAAAPMAVAATVAAMEEETEAAVMEVARREELMVDKWVEETLAGVD